MERTEGDAARAVAVVDIGGSAQVESMDLSHGRCIISGTCKINALLLCAPENPESNSSNELTNAEFIFPFKVEFENVEVGGQYDGIVRRRLLPERGRRTAISFMLTWRLPMPK